MPDELSDEVAEFLADVKLTEECPDELRLPTAQLTFDAVVGLKFPDFWEAWELPIVDLINGYDEDDDPLATVVGCSEQNDYWFADHIPGGCGGPSLLVPHDGEVHWVPVDQLSLSRRVGKVFEDLLRDAASSISPAMNVFWPVDRDVELDVRQDWATAVRSLPLVPVEIGTVSGFGLTGGGMDMSYWIAEAYVRCGWYPPQEIRDVPWPPTNDTERLVALAIWKTQRARELQAGGAVERLEKLVDMNDGEKARLLP